MIDIAPMPKYVAFLRAINVGGRLVKMDELRRHCTKLGLENVQTFIASGNVIFESRATAQVLERSIERCVKQAYGFESDTFIRSIDELKTIDAHHPFDRADAEGPGHRVYVGFTSARPGAAAKQALGALENPNDAFAVRNREVYWLSRVPMGESKVTMAKLEKAIGAAATFRNVTSVRKLLAKHG